MESSPELPPPPRPPLGQTFLIVLLAPLGSLAIAAVLAGVDPKGEAAIGVWFLTLPVMLVTSILCAVWIGQRKGLGMGFVAFFGIQALYLAAATAGCAAVAQGLNFH